MAKMGISTLQSYKGAQIFEAVGLSQVLKIIQSFKYASLIYITTFCITKWTIKKKKIELVWILWIKFIINTIILL